MPKDVPIFFYYCKDDEEVSFSDLEKYRQRVSWANYIELDSGGHQFTAGMEAVARDIKNLL